MIKLILFAPCEKIITGEDHRTSLISVLEHLALRGEIAEDLPPNAGYPMKWEAIALWHRPNEIGETVEFNAKVELFAPNGDIAMGSAVEFTVSDEHVNYRNLFPFPLFPIGQVGIHKAILSYKRKDTEEWEIAGEYPIRIIHELVEVKDESENQPESRQSVESV